MRTPRETQSLRPIPTSYAGVTFRSRLEADWAYNLTDLRIAWSYEPDGLILPSGQRYLPDFWLPASSTWLEVKGPGVPGLDKTDQLVNALAVPAEDSDEPLTRGDYGWTMRQAVVVALPADGCHPTFKVTCRYCGTWVDAYPRGRRTWHRAAVETCQDCGVTCFVTYDENCQMESRCWPCGGKTGALRTFNDFQRLPRTWPWTR